MFVNDLNPVLISVFGLDIKYYGLIYALGIMISLFFTLHKVRKREIRNLDEESTYELFIWLILGVVLGARLFYIIFYDLQYFIINPVEMLYIWNGGLSFHGGLVGGIIAAFAFCRKRRIDILEIMDVVAIPMAFALFLGRIANFINGELYGKITTLPWGVFFNGVEGARHPTQIYEALKNLLIFFVLIVIGSRRYKLDGVIGKMMKKKGAMFFMFMLLYGIMRFFIEFIKDLPIVFAGMTMGQILCVLMIIASLAFFLKKEPGKRSSEKSHGKSGKRKRS